MSSEQNILAGHFAKKQLASRSWLISWSHRSRFQIALDLAEQFAGKKLLDYGCGDGSFLAMLMNTPCPPAIAVGAEAYAEVIDDCRERFSTISALSFMAIEEIDKPDQDAAYDAVVCMEVLEHMLNPDSLLQKFSRLLTPTGKLLISVPVETGLPLLIKQTARRIAGWRGIGDYPGQTPYSFGELARGLLADGKRQHIERPIHANPSGAVHDHKGFNWMLLRKQLEQDFEIEKVLGSPLTWLSPHLASQVWFLARKKS
jgi:SAM-dependent methyltransferase